MRNDLFFYITKNKHLHVRVNLDMGMGNDVWFKAHGFSGLWFLASCIKEPYKYACSIPLKCVKVRHDLGSLGGPIINLLNLVLLL